MLEKSYPAIQIKQTANGAPIVLFAAPAAEIDMWGGIPQKQQEGDTAETPGFQRDENKQRIKKIEEFYRNPKNIIQNPLLCARRADGGGSVEFIPANEQPAGGSGILGTIKIHLKDYSQLSLLELMQMLQSNIEARVPDLADAEVDPELLAKLKNHANDHYEHLDISDIELDESDDEDQATENDITNDSAGVILSDESHIYDFWQQLAARNMLLEEIGDFPHDEFLFFSKDAVLSFLKPVVVVDGQHRLRGALENAKYLAENTLQSESEDAIIDGQDPDAILQENILKVSRNLPISLLMTDDPAEHVFQFIVVNQKATPIKPALLGTIVSTTLSNNELSRVNERLENAGIELQESRAVAFLSRYQDSPFAGKVEQGLPGEKKNELLGWSVMKSLVGIFQHLKGAKLYGYKNDYAKMWQKYLESSGIVENYQEKGFDTPIAYWSSSDGPWRKAFIVFWSCIKDKFSNDDQASHNYWGNPRESSLFNKVSLIILVSDFFKYLSTTRKVIRDHDHIKTLVEEWLDGVKENYFSREWGDLSGVKKDSTGIRKRWARLWTEYRENPESLPSYTLYSQPLAD